MSERCMLTSWNDQKRFEEHLAIHKNIFIHCKGIDKSLFICGCLFLIESEDQWEFEWGK